MFAANFFLVIPVQSDPDEAYKISGNFCGETHRAIPEPPSDNFRRARDPSNDIVRG